MFARKVGWAAIAELVYGTATSGTPLPCASTSNPRASVSAMPATHLLTVLTVAGQTIMASADGSTSGSPGFL